MNKSLAERGPAEFDGMGDELDADQCEQTSNNSSPAPFFLAAAAYLGAWWDCR